jgi:hypothetical protein
MVTQLVKILHAFRDTGGSLLWSQKPVIGPYPDPSSVSMFSQPVYLKIHIFNIDIILPSMDRSLSSDSSLEVFQSL